MLEIREIDAEEEVQVPTHDDVAQPTSPLPPSPIVPPSPPQQSPRSSPSQAAEGTSILVKGRQADTQAEIYNIDLDHTSKVLNPKEELHDDTPAETQSAKDKGKGIFVEDPKPMKKKDQIAMDAEYARKLQEEEEFLAQAKDA
nr:hypothetical protein [Tanacetum cinerariifolium]